MVDNRTSSKAGEFLCSLSLNLVVSCEGGRCSFLPKYFNLHLFSFCKSTLRALSLSSWAEINSETIGSIVLE